MHAFRSKLAIVAVAAFAPLLTAATGETEWQRQCRREVGERNDAEKATFFFRRTGTGAALRGKGEMDYDAKGSGTAAIYPTAAKDFMNPYGGGSLGVGYVASPANQPPHAAPPVVGRVSMSAIAKGFKPLEGAVKIKLMLDGRAFGPYETKQESVKDGMYSIWLDTAETDGDNKPPLLTPAQFAALARAVSTMRSAEVVLVRGGVDIVRLPVPVGRHAALRGEFATWASNARRSSPGCPNVPDIWN